MSTATESLGTNGSRGGAPRATEVPREVAASGVVEADARTVERWLASGECVLIDVREADEHARERIKGARLVPLSNFDASRIQASSGQRVVLHCKSGVRSADAARLAGGAMSPLTNAGIPILTLAGGIEAWKGANLPVVLDRRAPALNVMRQVQLVIGVGVLAGSALAWLVHPAFLVVPAFFGAGLTFAGATGTCALAEILGRMPWNRATKAGAGGSCASGASARGACSCDPCTCDPCKC